MCGRFTNRLTWDEIVRLYRLTIQAPPHNLPPRDNICPTDPVDVVTERDGNRDFVVAELPNREKDAAKAAVVTAASSARLDRHVHRPVADARWRVCRAERLSATSPALVQGDLPSRRLVAAGMELEQRRPIRANLREAFRAGGCLSPLTGVTKVIFIVVH
jgi:hypothetical protein